MAWTVARIRLACDSTSRAVRLEFTWHMMREHACYKLLVGFVWVHVMVIRDSDWRGAVQGARLGFAWRVTRIRLAYDSNRLLADAGRFGFAWCTTMIRVGYDSDSRGVRLGLAWRVTRICVACDSDLYGERHFTWRATQIGIVCDSASPGVRLGLVCRVGMAQDLDKCGARLGLSWRATRIGMACDSDGRGPWLRLAWCASLITKRFDLIRMAC